MITIASLYVYPVKSCRGIWLERALLTDTGLAYDREWMIVSESGRFLSQREVPRLALVGTTLTADALRLSAPGLTELAVSLVPPAERVEIVVWRDRCAALDQGVEAARWLSAFLRRPCRLVRFAPDGRRVSDPDWTGGEQSLVKFADAFALLAVSLASFDDLNRRLERPLPMSRFRPNLVLDGLDPYGEDEVEELSDGLIRLRCVKPCTRCTITTTNQESGEVESEEPLRTLKTYRWNPELKGVTFGQNLVVAAGAGSELRVGQRLAASGRRGSAPVV